MSDDAGKLRLEDPSTGYLFDFGTVTGISETFQKSCSVTPIVTKPKQSAFPIESRTYKIITVSFTRKQPESVNNTANDTVKWDNSTWTKLLMKSLDRWQARTNGYRLAYVPASDNPYIAPIRGANGSSSEIGYVKNLSLKCVKGRPESIQGSFEFHVGSMYVLSSAPSTPGYARSGFSITLTDSSGRNAVVLLSMGTSDDSSNINLVDSCTITGGPESPFEYAVIEIPRKEFSSLYPQLLSSSVNDLKAGKNKLVISIAGTSSMTLTKVKLSRNTLTLTAYCDAERIRGSVLNGQTTLSPQEWIRHVLSQNEYGVNFTGSDLVESYTAPSPKDTDKVKEDLLITFDQGTNVWFILQVAAMICGARVFFAQNKAYVIDYAQSEGLLDDANLRGSASSLYGGALTGNADLGDEGTDTIVNALKVRCSVPVLKDGVYAKDDSGAISYTTQDVSFDDEKSRDYYGTFDGGTYSMSALKQSPDGVKWMAMEAKTDAEGNPVTDEDGNPVMEENGGETVKYDQAGRFARNLMNYLSESQQTIQFTFRELRSGGSIGTWTPYFEPVSKIRSISDEVDEIHVNDLSDISGNTKPQKLALKTYTRNYPECTTEYTWGVLASMDLSSSTSKILSNISQ